MDEIRIELEGALYSADVVTRAAHRQTDRCEVAVRSIPSGYIVEFRPQGAHDAAAIEARYWSDLLDERLRERVATQTSNLKYVLLAAALREAGAPQA